MNDALTWRLDGQAVPASAEVVFHDFLDSGSGNAPSASADSQVSFTDSDSDFDEGVDLLNDNLDPVFQ